MAEDLPGLSVPIEASTALLRQQMEAAVQVVGGTTDRIDRSLSKVDRAFDRLDAATKAVNRAMGSVRKDMDAAASSVATSADQINRRLGIIGQGGSSKSRAADIEAWGRELDRLEGKFDPVTTATKRYEAELEDLHAAHSAGIVVGDAFQQQLQRIANEYDPATIAARKLREEAEQQAAAFRVLEDRLDKVGAAARKVADDQAKLDKALADNLITPERHASLSAVLTGSDQKAKLAAEWEGILATEAFAQKERIAQTKAQVAANWEAQLAMEVWGASEAKAKLAAEWEGILATEAFAQKERIAQTKAQVAANWEAQLAMEEMDRPVKQAAALQVLEDRLDKVGAAARQAADDQAKLDEALAAGRISYDRYTGLSRALREQNGVTQVVTQNTKLAAHEVTNLSYQLQDAAVQLAGGQNPLLVLMQQGPQATGAVGGVGRAMALLTSPAGVAAIAVGSVAAGLALVIGAAESHQRAMAEVSTATRLMGDRVGLSADQLERLAERAAETGTITVAAARQQEAAYIRTGNIGAASMEKLIALSRDYAAATKQDSDAAQADLAGMFADPVAAAEKLQASYGILNAAEMQHVRQLKATGQEEAARVLVADKLAVRVRGLADNTTTFAQAWERVGRAVSGAFDAVGKAASPETNAEAIRRLERERQQLIQARNLDRSRVDGETGGAASADAVPVDSRFSAPGMGSNGTQRLQQVDAELNQRRATEARAREQAAIRRNNQDRDRFGVEAAEITRAARPLGGQIDEVTEKVTKLRRAFGPDMAGASDETKRALGGFETQLSDLRAAEKKGVDIDTFKRQQQAAAEAKAATMVGVARERFLATEGKRIELIGTATSATERQTQVDQAGAAVTNNQTAAIAQQNAQANASIRGAVAAADAYRDSLAAGIEADARRQAQSEAVTSAIDVEARTRQIVTEKAGDEAVSLAQTTKQLAIETEAQKQVVAATDDGIAARMEAERAAQVTKATSAALAAAQAAEATGNTELAKKLRELAASYDGVSKSASELSKLDALKQYNQQQRDALDLARKEASLTGLSADERTRQLAVYQAEVQIRQRGIDITKDLSAEQRQEVERTRQLAVETANWQIATQHSEASWQAVGEAIDDSVVRPLESAVDAIVKGQGETVKWGNVWRAALTSLAVDAAKLAFVNPLKNELGLGSRSPTLWDLSGSGGTNSTQQVQGGSGLSSLTGGSNSFSLGGLASKASGGWLDRQMGGAISDAAGWLNTPLYGGGAVLNTGQVAQQAAQIGTGARELSSNAMQLAGSPGGGGVSVGDAIGGVGYGINAIMNFKNGNTIGGIGNAAATVMSFIPGLQAFAPFVAIGSQLLGGLFGQNRGKPAAAAGVQYTDSKQTYAASAIDNEGDSQQAQQLLQSIDAATAQFIALTGGKTNGGFGIGVEAKDGKYRTREGGPGGQLAGSYDTLDEAVIAGFRYNVSKGLISASDDVLKAVRNSTKTDINEFMADVSFAKDFRATFDAMNAALDPVNNQIKTYTANAKALGEQVKTNITDWRDTAKELGLATEGELTAAARKGITAMMGLGPAVEPLRGMAAVTKQAEIEFEAFRPALLSLGYTAAEVADMATRYTAKLVQARADAIAFTQRQGVAAIDALVDPLAKTSVLDRLAGLGLDRANARIIQLSQAIGWVETTAHSGTLTIGDERDAMTALDAALSEGYLSTDQYSTAVGYLTQAWSDSATVAREAAQAAQQLAAYQADLNSRMYGAVDRSRASGLLALDQQQAKELADARTAGYDVTQLQQVQRAERSQRAFDLAQQDMLEWYDRQIAAQQDVVSGLQDGAVKIAQVARQFQQARDSLAISEDAPISPQERSAEAIRQFEGAYRTATSTTASDADKEAARTLLTQLGPTLVSLEKTNSAGTARVIYDRVQQVFTELGDTTALGVDTADQQLEAAQDTLKELQRARNEAATLGQRQLGSLSDLRNTLYESFAAMGVALQPLERLTGAPSVVPHYSAPPQVQTAWDSLSGAQQFGIARAMGWGGQVDDAFNVWLATNDSRASTFGTDVTAIAGGARYAAPDDVGRAWEALTQAQQLAAVRSAGYDGGIDAGLNAWVQLGHAAAFEAAVRAQAHTAQVPGFAGGGFHAGGLRIVGERGPELEATGPARIWTADQIATAVAAARGDLGPNVVGFLPAGLGGPGNMAALVKAMEAVGGKIDSLSTKIEGLARTEVQQQASIAADLVDGLAGIKGEMQDLPRRIAGAM